MILEAIQVLFKLPQVGIREPLQVVLLLFGLIIVSVLALQSLSMFLQIQILSALLQGCSRQKLADL